MIILSGEVRGSYGLSNSITSNASLGPLNIEGKITNTSSTGLNTLTSIKETFESSLTLTATREERLGVSRRFRL